MRPWARIVSPRDRGKNPYPSALKSSGGYQLDGEAAPSTAICCVKYTTASDRTGGLQSGTDDSVTLSVAVGDEDGYIWACQPASRSHALEPFRAHMAPVCGVEYLDSEQLPCAAGSFVLASSGRDGECSVWRCQALALGQLPEGRPQVQQIVRVRSAIGSFCAARFLAWPAPIHPASVTEKSAQARARVLVAAPGCGEGGAFLCLCEEESEQQAMGGSTGVTSESKSQGDGEGARGSDPWAQGASWSQAWGCLLGPPEAPPGDIAAEALGMDRLKKKNKKKNRKKKKQQAGLMHLQGLEPAPGSEEEDEEDDEYDPDDAGGSPSSSMPGEAMLMHIDLVPQLRGALMIRSYDGGVVSCDTIAIPGVSGASQGGAGTSSDFRAPEMGRKTVSARAARCSVLCTATAPARMLGAPHGGGTRPFLVACGTSSRVLSFLVLRMKAGRGIQGAGAGTGGIEGGPGLLRTAKKTASGGTRPLVVELGVDGGVDGGGGVHRESASSSAPAPAPTSAAGFGSSSSIGSQSGPLVPESMCLGLALQLPTKGIAEVKWIPETEGGDAMGRRTGSAAGHSSGAGAGAWVEAGAVYHDDVAGHGSSSGPRSLLGVACWDGTLRLVRACVTSASDEEMQARRRGVSLQGGLLEEGGLQTKAKGMGKGKGKVKGWMPEALGPWEVRASQVMVLGAAAPHAGLMLAGAAAAAAAVAAAAATAAGAAGAGDRPGPGSRLAHEDGAPVGKRYLVDGAEAEAVGPAKADGIGASAMMSVRKTGISEQQVSAQPDAGQGQQQEQEQEQELAVLAEEFGIKNLNAGGLLRLSSARRRAAVAEAVGRGTNRAGGLLAAAPSREAQAVGWDPVSASAGPVHAGGATGLGVTISSGVMSGGGGGVVLAAGDKSGAVTAWLPLG